MTEMQGISCRPLVERTRKTATTSTIPLSIDVAETTEARIRRLISENPLIIFSRSSCCMCHVMRRLLATLGVHPTVIELDDAEMGRARAALEVQDSAESSSSGGPAVFIGGSHVGGMEGLMALHLSGRLLPMLREAGAAWL
ncbi:hypothetical protein AAC387_Pa05g2256 [Persea americana]